MATIIRAVHEGGVLRPTQPLALPEGERVDVIITQMKSPGLPLREPTLAEEDYARRIRAAKSLEEMFTVMATAPATSEDEFDIVKEINQSRQLTGFRVPDPDPTEENTR
jgi:predicted DNA-binding antitoxin AbrB/MazE fold protein